MSNINRCPHNERNTQFTCFDFENDCSYEDFKEKMKNSSHYVISYRIENRKLYAAFYYSPVNMLFPLEEAYKKTEEMLYLFFNTEGSDYPYLDLPFDTNCFSKEMHKAIQKNAKKYRVFTSKENILCFPFEFFCDLMMSGWLHEDFYGINVEKLKTLDYSFLDRQIIENVLNQITEDCFRAIVHYNL